MRMNYQKAGSLLCKGLELTAEELEKINRLTRREFSAEELYCFRVVLCDNEVDRDLEQFDPATLEQLAGLFVGKTGIRDHQLSSQNQQARIYEAAVEQFPGKYNSLGEPYCALVARAYMVRTESNRDLILEIEAGIKKEVSVGCSVRESVCSICGANRTLCDCGHHKGETYDGRLCYTILRDAQDAYEWSFVAVPAQPRAGVVKRFGSEGTELRTLRKQAELGQRYLTGLRREVVRLAMLADGHLDGKIFTKAVGRLDEAELLELKRAYEAQIAKKFPVAPQLRQQAETKREDEAVFLV